MSLKNSLPVKRGAMILTGISFLVLMVSSCKKDTSVNQDNSLTETQVVNEWIYDGMRAVYLWNKYIPTGLDPMTATDPKAFYHDMLYTEKDHWSYITDNYEELKAELTGEYTSMGFSPGFIRFGSGTTVGIFVEYVYPGSPAERAGLKRGDYIVSINGQALNTTNYYDLYSQDSYTAELGDLSTGTLKANGRTINLTSEVINADPVLYDTIFNVNGKKTGYLVFTEFTPGESDKYLQDMGSVFDNFKSGGTDDVLIDLRYNRGGSIDVARYMASCLAPASVVADNSVLVKNQYNPSLNNYIVSTEGSNSERLVTRFRDNGHNMNLNRVFFITSWGTASASELVITGLKPYMQVTTIGDTTVGKYTGMFVLTDTNDPPRHDWAMMPVVLKYANADGFTDFENGLTPDYYIRDDLRAAVPFGNLNDPMLAKALEVITGQPVSSATRKAAPGAPLQHMLPGRKSVKDNLFLPLDKNLERKILEDAKPALPAAP